MWAFFGGTSLRRELVEEHPWIFEQVTRQVFFRGSTFAERLSLMKTHYSAFEGCFTEDALRHIFLGDGLEMWRGEFQDLPLVLKLCCNSRDRREGLSSIVLKWGHQTLYRMIFWVGRNGDDSLTLRIGSLHGAAGKLRTYRDLTKHFFGYRPKNLVLYAVRMVARRLGADGIQAISNYGFFANNHLRVDRKLQTSLNEFWQETGGDFSTDPRFFDLPMDEPRKRLEDTKSHKHTLYKNRFALIDEIDRLIAQALDANLLASRPAARAANPPTGRIMDHAAAGVLSRRSDDQVMTTV